jgi:very-short-patch-repair endonuclease
VVVPGLRERQQVASRGWGVDYLPRLFSPWLTILRVKPRIPLPDDLQVRAFSAREGLDAGLGRRRMRGNDLDKPFRGVYVRGDLPLTYVARCEALLRRAPANSFVCIWSAARVMSIPLPSRIERSAIVDIGAFAPTSPPEGRGILGHCLELDETDIQLWNGIRMTSPEETWCSLANRLSVPELVAAGDHLIHYESPLATRESLGARVEKWAGKRGVRKLRYALDLLSERSESPQESKLRVIMIESGLRGLEVNFPIRTSGGYNYRADLAFPREKVIVEYQSAFHETPESFRADMTRTSRLEADEWTVIQVNKDDVANASELVARIRRVLRQRTTS